MSQRTGKAPKAQDMPTQYPSPLPGAEGEHSAARFSRATSVTGAGNVEMGKVWVSCGWCVFVRNLCQAEGCLGQCFQPLGKPEQIVVWLPARPGGGTGTVQQCPSRIRVPTGTICFRQNLNFVVESVWTRVAEMDCHDRTAHKSADAVVDDETWSRNRGRIGLIS